MINKREILLGSLALALPQAAWADEVICLPLKASLVNASDTMFGGLRLRNYSFLHIPAAEMKIENMIGSRLFLNRPCIPDHEKAEIRFYSKGALPLKAAINTASRQGLVLSSARVAKEGL